MSLTVVSVTNKGMSEETVVEVPLEVTLGLHVLNSGLCNKQRNE